MRRRKTGDSEYADKNLVPKDGMDGPLGEHAAPAAVDSEIGEGDDEGHRFVTPSIQTMGRSMS